MSEHQRSGGKAAKTKAKGKTKPKLKPQARASATKAVGDDPFAAREAEKYAHPIPSREAILELLAEHGEPMDMEAIAATLQLDGERELEALGRRLAAMLRDGQVLRNRRDGYAPVGKIDVIPGIVMANADGYGFLRPDEGGDDLYLAPTQMRRVLDGDRVLASIVNVDRRGRREGAIVEILERRSPRLVGRSAVDKGVMTVVPDDPHMHQDLLIPRGEDGGARDGQIVVAEITDWPTQRHGPIGRVVTVLGDKLEPTLVVEMAIASYDLPHTWPDAVIEAAETVPQEVTKTQRKGRVDLRKMPLVTIDGEDSRDFDDAVYAEAHGDGFRLVVAIADVSSYVAPNQPIDREAWQRGTSVYFPRFVLPMLPETLSNGICSLNPQVERLCLVCDMKVRKDGEVTGSKFYAAVMRSHARLTYRRVWQALGENDAAARHELADVLPQLEQLHKLYHALAKARQRRGAIEFDTGEVKFNLAASGEVVSMAVEPRNDAHKLIEECMIAANVQAARFLGRHKLPALYRVHAPPPADKFEDLQEFLRQYQLKLPPLDKLQPADYTALLRKLRERPEFALIQSVLLRSMSRAVYAPDDSGHFGLALDAYAHFTSPIRRYPDLLVHRAIHYALGKGKPADYTYSQAQMAALGVHCSECERRAEEAERSVDERFRCAWMEKHVGSEFDGVVTGVTSFGLFVELDESKVSGLVHVSQLPNDYYHFDPARRLLQGEHSGRCFRLGDAVRVQVLRASMEDRKIDFRLVGDARAENPSSSDRRKSEGHQHKPAGHKPSPSAGKRKPAGHKAPSPSKGKRRR